MVPWNMTMKSVKSGDFFMALGVVFMRGGALLSYYQQPVGSLTAKVAVVAALAIAPYVGALALMNVVYSKTTSETLPIVAAILAAFIIPALVLNSVIGKY